tara:strand:- start:208 stop:426 length:219 start_codon:yes stop_codon:yes gene_type:complete
MEFTNEIVNRKKSQSLTKFGLKVIFLKYTAKPHISRYERLLIPIGYPTTTSFINPAIKTRPYPSFSPPFKLQ